MITAEQEQFIRKYVSKDYFDVERVVDYLKLHDVVGGEIFAIAPLPEDRAAHPGRLELLREGFGFNAIDKETFIRRIPFYFYVTDGKGKHCGDLKVLFTDTIDLLSMVTKTTRKYMRGLNGYFTTIRSAL